ncbi:MAG: type II secretion system F family protein [Pseudomonadota bacterium]
MRSLVASNRAIVAQLLESYDRVFNAEATVKDQTTDAARPRFYALMRHTTPQALRRAGGVILSVAGVVAGSFSFLAGLLVLALGAGIIWFRLSRKERRRAALIDRDLPALLTSVASSVRAGIDPLRALADANSMFPPGSPFSLEVKLFKERITAGDDEFEVIDKFLADDYNSEVELFKSCLSLSRRHGSPLADSLHRVVRVVRQRQSFKRKTRAAMAMHRMSAIGIALCAGVICLTQFTTNYSGVKNAFNNPLGIALLGAGATLLVAGVTWMLFMGKEERL